MVTNSAILLKRNLTDQFDQVIEQLDAVFNGALNFKIVGPLPCYSFFTLEVKELIPVKIENARSTLDLSWETSEIEIKKAYLTKAGMSHPDKIQNSESDDDFNKVNNAYQVLIEYAQAFRQTSKENRILLAREKVVENLVLVKIKE
jgi:hypothetical protein